MGKRAGRHSMKQEEINRLACGAGKGGPLCGPVEGRDPFVFGRGGEGFGPGGGGNSL